MIAKAGSLASAALGLFDEFIEALIRSNKTCERHTVVSPLSGNAVKDFCLQNKRIREEKSTSR